MYIPFDSATSFLGIYFTVTVAGVQNDVYIRFFPEAVLERNSKILKS